MGRWLVRAYSVRRWFVPCWWLVLFVSPPHSAQDHACKREMGILGTGWRVEELGNQYIRSALIQRTEAWMLALQQEFSSLGQTFISVLGRVQRWMALAFFNCGCESSWQFWNCPRERPWAAWTPWSDFSHLFKEASNTLLGQPEMMNLWDYLVPNLGCVLFVRFFFYFKMVVQFVS